MSTTFKRLIKAAKASKSRVGKITEAMVVVIG